MKLGLMLQVCGGALEGGKTPRWPDLRDMALAAETERRRSNYQE